MKPNALVLALVTAATTLPGSAHAADDFCSRLFIYAVNQICQLLPNGQAVCQPIGLAGPGQGASCDSPSAQKMVQIPLGPPSIQLMPFAPNAVPYGPNLPAPNPFTPNPFTQNPFANNPFAANTYPPFPFAPNLFGPNPSAPAAAKTPSNAQPTSPTSPQAPVLPPITTAIVKPVAASVQTPPAEKQPAKPMPETPLVVTSAAVAKPTPAASVAQAAPEIAPNVAPAVVPKTPEPVKTTVVTASPAVVAPELPPQKAPLASNVDASAMTPAPKPAIETAAPLAVAPTPEVTPRPVNPAPAIGAEAAAEAAKAEKAIQDALAHFEFDSAELTPVGRAMLDSWLANTPKDAAIRVTGHADRLGPEPYNDKLSLLRAEAVKKYLTEKGKPANRIQILARGESMPLISCAGDANPETKSCLAPNRRAEITAKQAVKPVVKPTAKLVAKKTAKQKPKATVKTKPAKNKPTR
jgi:outer membrane protein OmpA-like peptidoglycan-associated protein